jgi:hypothetical protein
MRCFVNIDNELFHYQSLGEKSSDHIRILVAINLYFLLLFLYSQPHTTLF